MGERKKNVKEKGRKKRSQREREKERKKKKINERREKFNKIFFFSSQLQCTAIQSYAL